MNTHTGFNWNVCHCWLAQQCEAPGVFTFLERAGHPMRWWTVVAGIWFLAAQPLQAAAPITAAALAPDGRQVVLGSQAGIEVRTWPELAVIATWPTELVHVHDVKFSPDGQTLLAAGGSPAEEGGVEMRQWPSGELLRRVAAHDDVVYRVAWSPDGTQWATAGTDGICQTFSAATGQRLVRYEGHSRPVLSLAYLPDGESLVSVGVDQTLRLWESGSGRHVRTLDNHVGTVNDVAARPMSASQTAPVVATISEDRTIRFWQPSIGRLMRFVRLPSTPRAMAWSADGARLYVACSDGRIRVIDPDSLEMLDELEGLTGRPYELVLDSDGGRMLIGGESGCRCVKLMID